MSSNVGRGGMVRSNTKDTCVAFAVVVVVVVVILKSYLLLLAAHPAPHRVSIA